ncbi:MAG: GEVED domain-containing protein [Verrucomicrobiae bacterium]|nr:GEVED domain-containing protein [Verrucomicrobiae bacterium]
MKARTILQGRASPWLLAGLALVLCGPWLALSQTSPRDFGDAPDPYPTKLEANGARHVPGGVTLGNVVDTELDGQPDPEALGDDKVPDPQRPDEDGVTFLTPLIPGQTATVQVVVAGTSQRGYLYAWVDFGRNGSWAETQERIFFQQLVNRGTNVLQFLVPASAKEGPTFARFRISAENEQLSYVGLSSTGEVEDYRVFIEAQQFDFGDAPDSYRTTLEKDGARHVAVGPMLGWVRDTETDGQPGSDAKTDDQRPEGAPDDEDGVFLPGTLAPGRGASVEVVVTGNFERARLDAWVDFNRNGSFEDPEDQIFNDVPVFQGTNRLSFLVFSRAENGLTYARFRVSQGGKLNPYGLAPDGEVEDYPVIIQSEVDFGDAPAPYPTLLRDNGARHTVNADVYLGYQIDAETDGQPTPNADGDDLNPTSTYDEDGVIFTSAVVPGRQATVQVVASTRGRLYAWIDFNRNGSWADPGEQVFNGELLSPGWQILTFDVPENAVLGETFSRWRFTLQGGALSFTGSAPDGEVEDHKVKIIPDRERCDLGCEGREFWLTFPGNYAPDPDNPTRPSLAIQGPAGTTGTVSAPALGILVNYTIPTTLVARITLPTAADLGNLQDAITNLGIRVTANRDVRVTAFNHARYTTDSYQALNTSVLGTEYLVMAYGNVHAGVPYLNGSQFAIAAAHSNTVVTITPKVTVGSRLAGVPYQITLQPGQVYQLRATRDAPADLTGTVIKSDKPVAVFAGHHCANVPSDAVWFCDYVVEQLLPVNAWGNTFYVAPLATRSNGDILRILAAQDGTEVYVNGLLAATLNRGQYHQRLLTVRSEIYASKPVLLAQYATSSDFDGNPQADPFMVQVQATRHYSSAYIFVTPTNDFPVNYVQIMIPTFATNSVLLNGAPVSPSLFQPIGSTFMAVANVPVAVGRHILTADTSFGITVYGWGTYDSYGHPGCVYFGDVLEPQVMPPTVNYTVNVAQNPNNPGMAAVPNIAGQTTSKDNCGQEYPVPEQSIPAGTLLGPGVYTVNVYVADYSGNVGMVPVNVAVIDPSPVTIQCPPNLTVPCQNGQGAVVPFEVRAFTTYETNVAVVSTPPSGSFFPVGTTVVTNVATSTAGNTAVCTFTVTVTCEAKVSAALNRNGMFLNWGRMGTLEYSVNPTGPWFTVTSNTNQFLAPTTGPRGFYRVRYNEP